MRDADEPCIPLSCNTGRVWLPPLVYVPRRGHVSVGASFAARQIQRLNLTVDILVNAAGVCRVGRVEKCTDQDLEAQLMLNVVGTSRLTRLFAKGEVEVKNSRGSFRCNSSKPDILFGVFFLLWPDVTLLNIVHLTPTS